MLKQQLKDDLKQSMLSRDNETTSVLRMLISAIGYAEIQKGADRAQLGSSPASEADRGGGYEATDEDVMNVIQKEAKQHKDSIEQFKNAGREELVEKEEKELAILQKYLPEQMDEEEVKKLVADAVSKSGATSATDMGKVMGILMPQVKGKADGGLVSRLVREALPK